VAEGKALVALTKQKGMEGIIAKRKDSIYRPGKRTSDWLKIKARPQQELRIGELDRMRIARPSIVESRHSETEFLLL
jgi:ATP-dependent DNA ligase